MAPTAQSEDAMHAVNGEHAGESRAKWKYMDTLLSRDRTFTDDNAFEPGEIPINNITNARVLVIGAGGLGCEILKNLALSGIRNIDVIDMDTIDVSNLNRQFLFRESDVGRPKAEVAAEFVMKRCPGCKVTPYVGKIQDKDDDYYMQFTIVVCGLDSIEARRWINATLVGMVDMSNADSLKPLIDGGTEGFKGQSRVIFPTMTSCIECQLDMHAPRAAVPLCTLATIPRQPEHCIEWAHIIKWEEERKDDVLDTDDPEHITWLYRKALSRAEEFNIPGVTYSRTQGVVKNIIPAIASTNAIVAASCCNEAFKIITASAPYLGFPVDGTNNYMLYTGDSGVYTYTFEHQKKDDCPVCGNLPKDMSLDPDSTLQELVESLAERPESQLKKPNLRTEAKSLYYSTPASLEVSTRPNLKRKLAELLSDGEVIAVSDPAFQINFQYIARFPQ
ncbi:NEDD8 activating enzyme [Elasticomyces elasticus]|nr:NEDD8 activating enzyme [Elasticomyces elasticus]KAK3655976.1 NEDD8 activating enzyme [Elasticomyces elasticus]KAK4921476.1 NEDD8 activating enzyme [Elasticomyces elasticus]KAK5760053.1 NEDD8 activating enzyme [Elasticomyces elasticus]